MTELGDPATRVERIQTALMAALQPAQLRVIDDSEAHLGHAGAATGKGHFCVQIAAAQFAGQSVIAQHRAVYAALAPMMETDIHALSIKSSVA